MSSGEAIPPQVEPRPWSLAPEPEPVFGLGAVLVVFGATLLAVLVFGFGAVVVAHHLAALRHLPSSELAADPRVLLPAQLAAYLLIFVLLWRFCFHLGIGLFRALRWRWPPRWLGFLAGGVVLGAGVQWGAQWLPSPPEMPIDEMLRSAADAWLMAGFGVLIAPFAEEILFRGLLFPALARRTGAILSLIVTSALFGLLHAQQLAGAWAQVCCIVFVGVVLTAVRWRYHSLASSTLVHAGYNGVLFATLFLQSRGFTQLSGH